MLSFSCHPIIICLKLTRNSFQCSYYMLLFCTLYLMLYIYIYNVNYVWIYNIVAVAIWCSFFICCSADFILWLVDKTSYFVMSIYLMFCGFVLSSCCRMEDYERRQKRERDKLARQGKSNQSPYNESTLFYEPYRVSIPSITFLNRSIFMFSSIINIHSNDKLYERMWNVFVMKLSIISWRWRDEKTLYSLDSYIPANSTTSQPNHRFLFKLSHVSDFN